MKPPKQPLTLATAIHRSFKQGIKAIVRGDHAAADRWTSILERQIFCATRIDGLAKRTHKRRPLPPLPPKPEGAPIIRNGVPYNPIPESMKRQIAEADARLLAAQNKKLGITPREPK